MNRAHVHTRAVQRYRTNLGKRNPRARTMGRAIKVHVWGGQGGEEHQVNHICQGGQSRGVCVCVCGTRCVVKVCGVFKGGVCVGSVACKCVCVCVTSVCVCVCV